MIVQPARRSSELVSHGTEYGSGRWTFGNLSRVPEEQVGPEALIEKGAELRLGAGAPLEDAERSLSSSFALLAHRADDLGKLIPAGLGSPARAAGGFL